MRRIAKLVLAAAFGCATVWALTGGLSLPTASQAQGPAPLVLWDTIDVDGSPGSFEGVVVDCCASRYNVTYNDVYSGDLGFVDGNTLLPVAQRISIPSWSFDGWIAYNRYHNLAYVLQVVLRYTPEQWREVLVHVVEGRSIINTFSANAAWNTTIPVSDTFYNVDGIALQQPLDEANVFGRLIIDDTRGGNIDVLDVITDGTDLERAQRHSYRATDTMSPFWDNAGNSLAIETQHETLGVDDLDSTDLVYIADHNDPDIGYPNGYGFIQLLEISQPGTDLLVTRLPDVDMNDTWPFMNDVHGLSIAGPRDRLYVATAIQSFDNGYVGEVDTTDSEISRVVNLTYHDPGYVLVDWYDPKRVFVTTFDDFYNDPNQGLYLHLVYNGTVRDTLMLAENADPNDMRGMAFDPYHRRLYLTVGSQVMVVLVNYGAELPRMVAGDGIHTTGGELFAPDGSAHLAFPSGALSQSTVVTYEERYSPLPTADLRPVRFFTLTAVISGTTTPVLSTMTPYTSAFWYADAERRGVIEHSLALYRWDESGGQWSSEGITSTVDATANRLDAELDDFGLFAILGETERVFLPLVLRRH